MNFEKVTCQRCTRACFCAILGETKLCDLCLEAMVNDPETKTIMHSLFLVYGNIPNIEQEYKK